MVKSSAPPHGKAPTHTDAANATHEAEQKIRKAEEPAKGKKPGLFGTAAGFLADTYKTLAGQFSQGLTVGSRRFDNEDPDKILTSANLLSEFTTTAITDGKILARTGINVAKIGGHAGIGISHHIAPKTTAKAIDKVTEISEASKLLAAKHGPLAKKIVGVGLIGGGAGALGYVEYGRTPQKPALPIFAADGFSPSSPSAYFAPSGKIMSPAQFSKAAANINQPEGADNMFGHGDYARLQQARAAAAQKSSPEVTRASNDRDI